MRGKPNDDSLFDLCKLQSDTAGAFDDALLRHWYEAALLKVLQFIGRNGPVEQVTEPVMLKGDGSIQLSKRPSSDVRLTSGASVVATVPMPDSRLLPCNRDLCCYCHLVAHYSTGYDNDPACLPADIKQAVCRVFTWIVENRGDETQTEVIKNSGAKSFLMPYLATAL